MKNILITEDEFIRIFPGWLNPEEPAVVLCRNVVDIMRLRIFFHEKYSDRSFFNVHFLTLDQWINKLLPFHDFSARIIRGRLAEKAMIFQKLDEFLEQAVTGATDEKPRFLGELLKLPAFKNEVLYLWHLYSWNRQTQPEKLSTDGESALSGELFSFFNGVYANMKTNGFMPMPELFTSKKGLDNTENNKYAPPIYAEFANIRQAICLFPTDYNIIEYIKMNFVIKNNSCQWRFVLHDNNKKNSSNNELIKSLHELPDDTKIYSLKKPEHSTPAFNEWQKSNLNFFSFEPKSVEMKIRICKNTHDEYELIARSIRTLYDRGVPLHGIFVLYCTTKELPLLEYYLKNLGLGLNHPEKNSAATRPVISVAADLIDLLSLKFAAKKLMDTLSRNQFIELLLNPVFHVRGLCDTPESREKLVQFVYENNDMVTPVGLKSLQQQMQRLKDSDPVFKFINGFTNDRKNLYLTLLPSKHSQQFLRTLKKYLYESGLPEEQFKIQIDVVEKTLNSFLVLDRYFPEGMDPAFFYTLLFDEIPELKLRSAAAGINAEKLPEVYARNVQEGVHSPVDYLFICHLTSKAFPARDRHPDFIETRDDDIKYSLNLNAEDQKRKIRNCLFMVRRGYFLSFNLRQDTAPSDFIFEQIPVDSEKPLKKEKILEQLPFYERQMKDAETFAGISQYPENKYLDALNIAPETGEHALKLSFFSKFYYNKDKNNENPDGARRSFTGLSSPAKNETVSSAGNVENFAWCPQRFWFDKIQKLSPPVNYYDERYLERRHTGTLFHVSAKNLVNHLIQKFPREEYRKINKCINQDDMNILLKESFKTGEQTLLDNNKIDYNIFSKGVIQRAYEQFDDYFKRFFYLAENEKHPLYDHYPLATELAFENIALGPFVFRGRIDRIDYFSKNQTACILDYKTGNSTGETWNADDIKSLGKFQLPLYIKATCILIKQNTDGWPKNIANIQGAYEFTADAKKSKTTFFMEIKEDQTSYPVNEIEAELELLLENSLQALDEVLASGYFFAYGHKKTPDARWESKCEYCDYALICDRAPYGSMIHRINSDPLAKKFLNTLYFEK